MPFSYAAVVLNPTMKEQWFADRWSSGIAKQRAWISQIEEQVRQHWLQFYKHRDKPTRASPSSSVWVAPSAASDDLRERLRVYERVELDHEASADDIDDFEKYLRTDLGPHSIPSNIGFTVVKQRLSSRGSHLIAWPFCQCAMAANALSVLKGISFTTSAVDSSVTSPRHVRVFGIGTCKPIPKTAGIKSVDGHGNT